MFINQNRVNIDDLIHGGPGSIVRCNGNPNTVIRYDTTADLPIVDFR
jgi:hypothetical protein